MHENLGQIHGSVWQELLLTLILVLASAYFVGAETALVALRGSRVRQLEAEGKPRDRWLLKLSKNPSEWLGAVQLGITIVNFIGGAAVIAVTAPVLAPFFDGIAPGYGLAAAYVVVTALLTYVFLIFGELVPKMLAIVYPERVSRISAPFLVFFIWITYPFVWLISASTLVFSRPFTKGRVSQGDVSEQEIEHMILGHTAIPHFEKELARRIFKFGDTLAHEIMTPRPDVVALPADATLAELRRAAQASGHSRFPVYENDIDHIIGVVMLKDALLDSDAGESTAVAKWLRTEIPYLPETLPILRIYRALEASRSHFAVIIDEHGGTAGIATLEDIVEEVFGDIQDEHDTAGLSWRKAGEGVLVVDGIAAVRHLNHELGLGLPVGDGYETVAGLIMDRLGRIPKEGDVVSFGNAVIEVVHVKRNRIVRVRIERKEATGKALGKGGET